MKNEMERSGERRLWPSCTFGRDSTVMQCHSMSGAQEPVRSVVAERVV
jgi:hypothetical protein